jgi:hypothetical protein
MSSTRSPRWTPLRAQPVGNLARARRHVGIADLALAAVFLDHPQGRGLVAAGLDVEEVERPVELIEFGRPVVAVGGVVVEAVLLQEVARLDEALVGGCGHGCLLVCSVSNILPWLADGIGLQACQP